MLHRCIATIYSPGREAQGGSRRNGGQALVRNSPYFRPGTDGGDDDAALSGDVPEGRWPGLRTREPGMKNSSPRRTRVCGRM